MVYFENLENMFPPSQYSVFICIGYSNMNAGRKDAYQRIIEKGYQVSTYIHPTALVQTEDIGEGCLVFENVTIGAYCSVGVGNIFYPCSHVAHHTHIGDFNFFAVSCSVAGHVTVRNQCFLGNNCTTKNGIVLMDKTLVGASAYLAWDTAIGDVVVPPRSFKLENTFSSDIRI